ncbi:hypothetical protein D3C87_2171000 [compost metagenome]
MATAKISCRSGTVTSARERAKAPDSAKGLVMSPVRWRRHSKIALAIRPIPRRETPKVGVSLRASQACT